jgi:nicotinamide riboside kinase
MLISFSGAQSTGKTTLLKHLEERNSSNPLFKFVPEVTRLIKREYDLPINEDGTDITQLLIINQHLCNAYKIDTNEYNYILDRCSLDGLVYTHWLCDQRKLSMSVYSFAEYIFSSTINKYDVIFYTSPNDVKLEYDGERSVDTTFRDGIIDLFNRYIKYRNINVVLLYGTVEERLKIIKDTLAEKGLEINI